MRKKTLYAVLFWFFLYLFGMLEVFLGFDAVNDPLIIYATLFTIIFSLFAWVLEDAAELGFKPSAGLKIGVILIPFIVIPYYRFKHTGFKQGLIFILKIFGIYIMTSMVITILFSGFM